FDTIKIDKHFIKDGLGYFELQPLGRVRDLIQDFGYTVGEPGTQELRRGKVDCQDEMRGPPRRLAAGLFKHPRSNIT
ncbi:hypothetical protein ACC720_39580, partial [Rhizobium ruizarguesonis]